jgi:acid phosphatase family membrane protein YuiD
MAFILLAVFAAIVAFDAIAARRERRGFPCSL